MKYKAIINYKVNTSEKLTIYSRFIERLIDQMRIKPIITEKTNEYIIEFVFEDNAPDEKEALEELTLDLNQLFLSKTTYPDKAEFTVKNEEDVDIAEILNNITIEVG